MGRLGVFYLDQISSQQLWLPSRDAVVQDLPTLAQAELHDVMLDRCCVIGRRDPGEQDSLLCPIGCEAPWWGKQHQWFRGTCRKYWGEHTGIWGGLREFLNTDTRGANPAARHDSIRSFRISTLRRPKWVFSDWARTGIRVGYHSKCFYTKPISKPWFQYWFQNNIFFFNMRCSTITKMHCNAFSIFTCDSNQDFLPNEVCCYFRAFRYVLATNVAFCSIVKNLNVGEQHTGFVSVFSSLRFNVRANCWQPKILTLVWQMVIGWQTTLGVTFLDNGIYQQKMNHFSKFKRI